MPAAPHHVAVVGAGLAGLTLAHALVEAGREVTVFDKGRGPGGRLATRRAEPYTFDHGAQYFTARDPGFRAVVDDWVARGIAARWDGRLAVLDAPPGGDAAGTARGPHALRPLAQGAADQRYVGVPGMNAPARHLADLLGERLRRGVRVGAVSPRGAAHGLCDESGVELGTFDAVLVATPPSQAEPLVGASPMLAEVARDTEMDPCWAVMLAFERPCAAPFDGAFVNGGPLAWVARDSSKPGRASSDTWVLHASPAWTRAHLEDPAEQVAVVLSGAFASALGEAVPPVAHRAAHRWRFAAAAPPREDACAYDDERRLGLAGDWLAGSKVQGAWRSGAALAQRFRAAHG